MKRTVLIVTGLACLVLAAGCKDKGAYPKPKGALRIVQYNVGVFSKEIDNSIPMVAAMMSELRADALSLNELDSCNTRHANHQASDLAAEMGGWNYRFSRAMPYREGAYGVGVAVPDEILGHMTVALPKDSGSEPRACCVVETPRYVLASTHLDHRSTEAAVLQAKTITDALKSRYGDSDKPVFLAGDLNSLPGSEVLSTLKKDWTVLSLEDNTYPSDGANICIDYILRLDNKAKIEVVGAGVPAEFKSGDVAVASDHLPIYLDVKIK
ncbi:MAG: endonuclease/exonuclease/phosphatase family protein [Bacteroidales bacterium]|nr:endonuclease/exonuclease/phosphatase family protein [Bacteroidales bacterium]